MSKSLSYRFKGTKGELINIIQSLPSNPNKLLKKGWKDISNTKMKENTNSMDLLDPNSGLAVRFDKGDPNANGFRKVDHYHVYNPKSASTDQKYVDANGNPVHKNSDKSHIIPEN